MLERLFSDGETSSCEIFLDQICDFLSPFEKSVWTTWYISYVKSGDTILNGNKNGASIHICGAPYHIKQGRLMLSRGHVICAWGRVLN